MKSLEWKIGPINFRGITLLISLTMNLTNSPSGLQTQEEKYNLVANYEILLNTFPLALPKTK